MYHKHPMSYICNITDLSQGGVVFQKQQQKHVIGGPFGLFYMPHNFPIRRNWSGYLWVKMDNTEITIHTFMFVFIALCAQDVK